MAKYSKTRQNIEFAGISIFNFFLRNLPLSVSRGIASGIGFVLGNIIRIRSKVALENLRQAFPEKPYKELNDIYKQCWKHMMRVGVEFAKLPDLDVETMGKYIEYENLDVFKKALDKGKGIIFVSGHLGNWEWLGGCASLTGFPVTYVITTQSNKRVEQWINDLRGSTGIKIIYKDQAIRGVFSSLKKNEAIAMLSDQNGGHQGVFVPFFNRLASTFKGPAMFHLKTGSPIIYGTALRQKNGKYKVKMEELTFDTLTDDREEDIRIIMTEVTARLERDIRQYPEQWLWLHRRWKTRPPYEK